MVYTSLYFTRLYISICFEIPIEYNEAEETVKEPLELRYELRVFSNTSFCI